MIGKSQGRNFALPFSYQFSGQQASYSLQKALYIQRHQRKRGEPAGSQTFAGLQRLSQYIREGDLALEFGEPRLAQSVSCATPSAA